MLVFFELGNSRLKAAVLDNGSYEYLGGVVYDGHSTVELLKSFQIDAHDVEFVYACSVVDSMLSAEFTHSVQTIFKCYPTFLNTQPNCCGIQCGYTDFEKFGSDRWMAIIGACSNQTQPAFIVDAGTAITVDVVIDQQHMGGFIVPGLETMKASLLEATGIKPEWVAHDNQLPETLLATDTSTGIAAGTLYMVSAYINTLLADLSSDTGLQFMCVGTGGDFVRLQPMLDGDFDYIEDLTLLGMVEVIESLKK